MRVLLILTGAASSWAAVPLATSIDGPKLALFQPQGAAELVFFVCTDCPISNGYAPEIQRICATYRTKDVSCTLVYEDVTVNAGEVRKHLAEYGYRNIRATIDRNRAIAKYAKATVTPQAVLVDKKGVIRYRGRINNLYTDLGKPRRQITEHDLSDALDALLAGRAIANLETKALGCYIVDPEVFK